MQLPTEPAPSPRASVIVKTRDRSASLQRTILSILGCADHGDTYEVIVVDNASTDDTRQVVERLRRQHPDRCVQYVFECRLGTHYSWHAGARAARASLLLFTDDDVEVEQQWIQAYIQAFDAHPEMVAAGGPVFPHWEVEPPLWLRELVTGDVASQGYCGELSLKDNGPDFLLASYCSFFGVNMAVRAGALRAFGGFHPDIFGHDPSSALGGGENGLNLVMQRAGAAIGYVPEARVWHRIPASRMRPEHFERWAWIGAASVMFDHWRGHTRIPWSFVADIGRILRAYWRPWTKAIVTRRRPDPRAVRIRSTARLGLYQLLYLGRIIYRSDLRTFLDAESFGP